MSNTRSTNTDQFDTTKFRPHGRVEYEERGQLLCATALGPFNMELMGALVDMAKATFPTMTAKGRWAHIATFRNSALCAPQVLEGVTDAMKQMIQLGVAPEITAFVLPTDVEGAALMGPLYAKAFEDAGARLEFFQSFDSAQKWVESVLGPVVR